MLERSLDVGDYVLVNVPLGPGWQQGAAYSNPYEEHRSAWELIDFEPIAPLRQSIFDDYLGRRYGAFLLSRGNPREIPPA